MCVAILQCVQWVCAVRRIAHRRSERLGKNPLSIRCIACVACARCVDPSHRKVKQLPLGETTAIHGGIVPPLSSWRVRHLFTWRNYAERGLAAEWSIERRSQLASCHGQRRGTAACLPLPIQRAQRLALPTDVTWTAERQRRKRHKYRIE